jgi:hypothetical protein
LLYAKRDLYNTYNKKYKIIKQKFMNYRLLSGKVLVNKQNVFSHFLPYSSINNKKVSGKIEYTINNTHYLNKNEVKIIDIDTYNKYTKSNYKNIQELIYNPLPFKVENDFKSKLLNNSFDISCVVVLDNIPTTKIEIFLDSKLYEDIKEDIILL